MRAGYKASVKKGFFGKSFGSLPSVSMRHNDTKASEEENIAKSSEKDTVDRLSRRTFVVWRLGE